MLNEVINVGDLRKTVKESTKEFNAKMGVGVETENKKNNEKSYKESSKKIEDFDGGIRNTARKIERSDDKNRTVLDYTPSIEPDEKYKKRVKAQSKGYTSELEEKNGIEKNGEFDDEAKIYNSMKKNADEINKQKSNITNHPKNIPNSLEFGMFHIINSDDEL